MYDTSADLNFSNLQGEKSTIRTLSEPQFAALNSQVHAGEVERKEESKDDGVSPYTLFRDKIARE